MKRATKTTKTRRYRYTKKNPRSQRAIFKVDRGNVEQVISLIFPPNTQLNDIEIPKEKNPDLKTLYFGNMKLACYIHKNEFQKGFIYDNDGIYCGKFHFHDLKNIFVQIGAFLKEIKTSNG